MDELREYSDSEIIRIKDKAEKAKNVIKGNLRKFQHYPTQLLIAGSTYPGIWLEHNQDNIYLAGMDPEAAWASQQLFMDYQREDGLLPFMFLLEPESGALSPASYWHIQSVYPFAACAMEIALKIQKREDTFAEIYQVASRYDEWFVKFRNRNKTGLVEMYCEWDTGHDNDPRVVDGGIPHTCPGKDATNMPDLPIMPILSVDLSAMLYGGRIALSKLAMLLGKEKERLLWLEKAEELKSKIHELLYDPEDDFYYDRDKNGFRKYRSEHITRLFLNQVLSPDDFNRIFDRYFTTEQEFWPYLPIPSMSVSDNSFVRECHRNCWGGKQSSVNGSQSFDVVGTLRKRYSAIRFDAQMARRQYG